MPRTVTVKRLARSRGVDPDELLLVLWDAGHDIEDTSKRLSPHQLKSVRSTLRELRLAEAKTRQSKSEQGTTESDTEWRELPQLPFEPRQELSAEDVLHVHEVLTEAFVGSQDAVDPPGLKDRGTLESALARPRAGIEFEQPKYGSITLAAAALLHSLIANHAFHNGNKRTALVAYVWFLRLNGRYLLFTEDALYRQVVAAASHKLSSADLPSWRRSDAEVLALYEWTDQYTRAPQRGDRLTDWRRLERLLRSHGAEFSTPRHNKIDITIGHRRAQVVLPRRGSQITPGSIAKIRSELELDEAHGCDSAVFYEGAPRPKDPASIIKRYSQTLRKLSQYDRGEVLVEAAHSWSRK